MKPISQFLVVGCILIAPALAAQPAPRRPRGVYAEMHLENDITQQQRMNSSITTAELHAYFTSLYSSLLVNPAVSGLAWGVGWSTLNPRPQSSAEPYDWSYMDDAFASVSAWNTANPTQPPKTIQVQVSAGFYTPTWVMDQIPSCDGLFRSPVQNPPGNCGKATFKCFVEGCPTEPAGGRELPMPWNTLYKGYFKTFLAALAARYGGNPAFVSMDVSGPTASSSEMILPDNNNAANPQTQFGAPIAPNDMWLKLLAFAYPSQPVSFQKSDQAFINEWNAAIDMFGQIFSGLTLVATTGSGLPDFGNSNFTVPPAFAPDCPRPTMDCAAETTILSHFADPNVGGLNAKATQGSGMKARRPTGAFDLGIGATKFLSQSTAQFTSSSAQILGGQQFATSFSNSRFQTLDEGCTVLFPGSSDTPAGCAVAPTCTEQSCPAACVPQNCLAPGVTPAALAPYNLLNEVPASDLLSPEQAAYNVLKVYFDGTPAAAVFGGTPGAAPMNYLQIYVVDFTYAAAHAGAPARVVKTDSTTLSMSAQDLLNLANQKLWQIGEPLPSITPGEITPVFSAAGVVQPGEWASIYGVNLAGGTASWTGDFPTSLAGTSVTIDGRAAYLSYVSPEQINLQVPDDPATGAVPVSVTTPFGRAASTVTLAQFGPSFLLLDARHVAAIILRSDGSGAYGGGVYDILGPTGNSLGYRTVAAKAGDFIELFGAGFGPTNPAVPAGQAFAGSAPTTNPVTLRINNVTITPAFAGLSSAGVYQLNLTVPPGLGSGDVSLQASVGGVQAPAGILISLQ